MKITILDGKTLGEDLNLTLLSKFGELKIYPVTKTSEKIKNIGNSEIIITNKVIIDRDTMVKCKELKLIVIAATGYNNIDIKAAEELGIAVTNVTGYSTESVVQHTFAVILNLLHNLQYYDNYVKNGEYSKSDIFTHIERSFWSLKNRTLGIIGLGSIGRKVADTAELFGMKTVYFSTSGIDRKEKVQKVSLEDLLRNSDIVTIHSPLNDKTNNLLNKENLILMKKSSILINMGRGGIVNEDDIVTALNNKTICCFGTDVLTVEPITANNPLFKIKDKNRVLITPHIAWTSKESREKLINEVALNIESYLKGQKRNNLF